MTLASRIETTKFVDNQIKRILAFEETTLVPAVEMMANTMPSETEHTEISKLIQKYIGEEKTERILADVVSWWDEFNAVTAAANLVNTEHKARELQVKGGEMLSQFLA